MTRIPLDIFSGIKELVNFNMDSENECRDRSPDPNSTAKDTSGARSKNAPTTEQDRAIPSSQRPVREDGDMRNSSRDEYLQNLKCDHTLRRILEAGYHNLDEEDVEIWRRCPADRVSDQRRDAREGDEQRR